MLRVIASFALILLAGPAAAQISLNLDAAGGDAGTPGRSTATVTEEDTTPQAGDGGFASATVLSAVNVRSAPSTTNSEVIGTLQQGGTVSVRCRLSWCELQDGGYVAQKFLTLDIGGSFQVVSPPADGVTTAGDATTAELAAPDATPAAPAVSFDGTWTVTNDPSGKPASLTLTQTGATVAGTLTSQNRVTQITGDIQGAQLTFTYKMANIQGAQVATGSGFLTLQPDGSALSGNLMLNGLVIANIRANR